MEAKSLMIGDWVHLNDINVNLKVVSISTPIYADWNGDENYNIITANYDLPNYGDYIESKEEEVEPIELTPEILAKNGWERRGCLSRHKDNVGVIHHWGNGIYFFNYNIPNLPPIMIPFHYVHELQYALRLCGLTKLADNFKV